MTLDQLHTMLERCQMRPDSMTVRDSKIIAEVLRRAVLVVESARHPTRINELNRRLEGFDVALKTADRREFRDAR